MDMDEEYLRLFKKLRKENYVLQQSAMEDKKTILFTVAEIILDHEMDSEYVQAIYLQPKLNASKGGARNAASTILTNTKLNKYEDPNVLGNGACGTLFEVTWLGIRCVLEVLNVQDESHCLEGTISSKRYSTLSLLGNFISQSELPFIDAADAQRSWCLHRRSIKEDATF